MHRAIEVAFGNEMKRGEFFWCREGGTLGIGQRWNSDCLLLSKQRDVKVSVYY